MPSKETTDTFSATMRKLHKEDPKKMMEFARAFKKAFDDAMESGVEDHQSVALLQAKQSVAFLDESRFLKLAQTIMSSNRNPQEVGASLAGVIKILMGKLPYDRRDALENMRGKILKLNPTEISTSSMPETAAYGQSITLIKTLLNGYGSEYIKQVITFTARSLY